MELPHSLNFGMAPTLYNDHYEERRVSCVEQKFLIKENIVPEDDRNIPARSNSVPNESFITSRESFGLYRAIVLSQWDNIIGPKVEHLWNINTSQEFSKKLMVHISTQSLSGSVCREIDKSYIDSIFHEIKNSDLLNCSFIFGAMDSDDIELHSLSLIIPSSRKSEFLELYSFVELWMKRIIRKSCIILRKESYDTCYLTISELIQEFMNVCSSLKVNAIPKEIDISETCLNYSCIDHVFLRKAISSHLMNCGYSLVIGQTCASVNMMIATLALFLNESDRLLCSYVCEKKNQRYTPGLRIQGIIKDSDSSHGLIAFQELMLNPYPSSIIDLTTKDVRQSSSFRKHSYIHQKMNDDEIHLLWQGKLSGNSLLKSHTLREHDDSDTLIGPFLNEISMIIGNDSAVKTFIKNFLCLLHQKAMSLILHLESEMSENRFYGANAKNLKKLQLDMCFNSSSDMKIIIAFAEFLKQGMFYYLHSCGKIA